MPLVSRTPSIEAIFCADLHLSHLPPISRSPDKEDWYKVQKRYLDHITKLSKRNTLFPIPVICAGDVFDKWNPPNELVNFALKNLPHMYAVPGQHDLPNHNLEDIRKSGFWTLSLAKKITPLLGDPVQVNNLRLRGFAWGIPLSPCEEVPHSLLFDVAVVHDLFWVKGKGFHGAPENKRVKNRSESFSGYDVVVTGDNHKPFHVIVGDTQIINCGSLMRRTSDQYEYKPCVWLLMSDGSIERSYLDVSKDRFLDFEEKRDKKVAGSKTLEEFLVKLRDLKDVTVTFEEAVANYMHKFKVKDEIKEIILCAMEDMK